MLILDEPTASLDVKAESEIYADFSRMAKGRTTVFISHRLAAAMFAERIVVMDGGQIAESGSHTELMQCGGMYARCLRRRARHMFRSVNKKYSPFGSHNELRGSFVFSHSRCFALVINYFIQHNFLCALFYVVHFLRPTKRVCGFEFFGDAALFYQPGEGEIDLPLCLLLGIVKVLVERARSEEAWCRCRGGAF